MIASFVFAFIVIAIVALIYATKPRRNVESARIQTEQLVASVGGAARVCDEASQIFKRFGVSQVKFFNPTELTDYPAIAALGKVDGIWPGSPPYIKIRVGTHLSGFIIEIVDANGATKYPKSPAGLEVEACIFVHR